MKGKICAVIAAAGLSSRMGAFKPLLPFSGSSVIRHCAENLLAAGAEELVVVTGHRGTEIAAELAELDVRIVDNPDYATTQMFDSLRIGMRALSAPCEKLLLTPGDVPWVSPELIIRLLDTDADFVCPICGGRRGHPVVLAGERIPAILDCSDEGGLRGAVESLGLSISFVETPEIGVTLDLDTPEDYRRLTQLIE